MSHSLWPHGLQHNRLFCPSLAPGVCSDSRPLSWSCYLTISSSAIPFSFSLNLSQFQGLFQWVSSSHQVAKVFELSVTPCNEYSGLISFRIDWFDLLAVKGLLLHHNSKASFLQLSDFFMVQLSHMHMTTGETIDLTMWTFISKAMSLLCNMLSSFCIVLLSWSILNVF